MPAERNATVRDVAARAGVSLSTVSNVLNRPDRVSPATLRRVRQAIDEVGFVRNDAARALRLGESQAVGIVLSEATSPFYAEVARAASVRLAASGMSALIGSAGHDAATADRLTELFESQRVRGLLVNPLGPVSDALASAKRRGIPIVHVDGAASWPGGCSVSTGHRAGGRMAVEHLRALGRSRIALVRGPIELPQISLRMDGARDACERLGLACEEIVASTYFVKGGMEAGAVIASRGVNERPDGVFAANDILAMGVVAALMERQVDVPSDVAVVGYDDTDFALAARVPLTTIRQPAADIGTRAATLLIEEITRDLGHRHENTLFRPELVARASTLGESGP